MDFRKNFQQLSAGLHRPDRRFAADMLYGLPASGSCLLTDIADQLHEKGMVRKLKAINALNFYITAAMAFLARVSEKSETNYLKVAIIRHANPIKTQVHFLYFRLAKGIVSILSYAQEGVRQWFKTQRPRYRQLTLKLIC